MPAVSMSLHERRARLARRQRLAPSAYATDFAELARDLVALHGTDPASVFLSAAARMKQPSVADIEHAMYDERSVVRMLGMRRTMFLVSDELAPVVHAACTRAIAVRLKRQYQKFLDDAGIVDDVGSWWTRIEQATLAALEKRREATAQELGQDVPELKKQFRFAVGKNYEGAQSVVSWMLTTLAAEGKVVRARPRGSWTSSQYRWAPIDAWLPNGLAKLATDSAQQTLVREWLRAYGPGTLDDLRWWSGLTMGEVKRALTAVEVVEVALGESAGLMLADDFGSVRVEPWVALLPALDVTPMAYMQRDWYLGSHGPALFDRSGNIGPSVWSDGRIVGGWAQRPNGAIAYKLLEDVGREVDRSIQDAAGRLGTWLGSARITPRFRTPLERQLSA